MLWCTEEELCDMFNFDETSLDTRHTFPLLIQLTILFRFMVWI